MDKNIKLSIGLSLIVLLSIMHLFIGVTNIDFQDFVASLVDYDSTNIQHIIARDLRLTRLFAAIISGAGLSVAGLLMQTIFNNPLAGPNVLGISTGSSLFVAITLLTGIHFFQSDLGLIASALLGATVFGIIILFFAKFVRSQTSLLLIGIMLGSFSASFISVLIAWSDAHQLKLYTLWSMGSLQQISFSQIPLIFSLFCLVVLICLFMTRSLNALVIGQENASMLGIQVKNVRFVVLLIASILTGLITAFCGPIAFIGMAIPNLVKLLFKTQNHLFLIIGSILLGACFMLFCDILIQLFSEKMVLPVNAMTSMLGAPFVIYIILKRWS